MNAPATGIIDIRGKQYLSVALRVTMFREKFPDHGLTTEVVERDPECVVVKAFIADQTGRILATGHAEEYRKSSQINRTSALENAETSAIGRALAAFGFGGTEFASANEVQNAIHQQGATQGHSQQGAVSPEAPKKEPAHSALKTAVRGFVHEMEGIGDWDEWCGFRESREFKSLVADLKAKLPQWYDGGPDMPADFVPLHRRIELKEAELSQAIADIARV